MNTLLENEGLILVFKETAIICLALLGIREIRKRILVPLMFVPAVFISRAQSKHFESARERLARKGSCTFVQIKSVDKRVPEHHLDGVEWYNPTVNEQSPLKQRWIIWFNPNAALYEDMMDFLKIYGKAVRANVLAFNYRGIGKSGGRLENGEDLLQDGLAAFHHLTSKYPDLSPSQILLHGHSLGGIAAAYVRSQYPEGPVVNDRSFSSFSAAASSIIRKVAPMRALAGTVIGGISSAVILPLLPLWGAITAVFTSAVAGGMLAFALPEQSALLADHAVRKMGWHLNAIPFWEKIVGPKIAIQHPLDGIIGSDAGLIKQLSPSMRKTTTIVDLEFTVPEEPSASQLYHCYALHTVDKEWTLVQKHLNELWQ